MAHSKCMPFAYLLWINWMTVAATHTANTTTTISTATTITNIDYPRGCDPDIIQITLGMVLGGMFYFMCTWSMIGSLVSLLYDCRETWKLRRLHRDNKAVTQVDATVTNKRPYYLDFTFTGTHPDHGPFRVIRKKLGIEESLYEELKVGGSVPVCYSDADPKNCHALEHYVSEARNEKATHLYVIVGSLLVVVAVIAAVSIWILSDYFCRVPLPACRERRVCLWLQEVLRI